MAPIPGPSRPLVPTVDPDDWDDYADEEEPAFDCGLFVEDGVWYCSGAGSEECDWECPDCSLIGTAVDELEDVETP